MKMALAVAAFCGLLLLGLAFQNEACSQCLSQVRLRDRLQVRSFRHSAPIRCFPRQPMIQTGCCPHPLRPLHGSGFCGDIARSCNGCISQVTPFIEAETIPSDPRTVDSSNSHLANRTVALFNGTDLKPWIKTKFGGEGEIEVKDNEIVIEMGNGLTGIHREGDFPKQDYELVVVAKRIEGEDMVCGITFPVGDQFCSLIVGGWGGSTVGISSINNRDASDNETTKIMKIEHDRWYRIVIRVDDTKIRCYLDDERVVDVERKGRNFSLRGDCDLAKPVGIFAYGTKVAIQKIYYRPLTESGSR